MQPRVPDSDTGDALDGADPIGGGQGMVGEGGEEVGEDGEDDGGAQELDRAEQEADASEGDGAWIGRHSFLLWKMQCGLFVQCQREREKEKKGSLERVKLCLLKELQNEMLHKERTIAS